MFQGFEDAEDSVRLYKGYHIRRFNPYGFWMICNTDGKPAKEFPDSYTMSTLAAKALDSHLEKAKSKKR